VIFLLLHGNRGTGAFPDVDRNQLDAEGSQGRASVRPELAASSCSPNAASTCELALNSPGRRNFGLEDLGWIHVFDSGSVMGTSPLTQAQMDTLFDLACAHPTMRRWLMIGLEIASSGEDADTVMRRHGVRVRT
jgi:hypothetical protein